MSEGLTLRIWLLLGAAMALVSCTSAVNMTLDYTPKPYVQIDHPDWSKDAVIYQINTRQFTPEGTFSAAETQLPRLAELGVDILWLMPIHPIGEINRKGSLGSPYAVRDYRAVNPELGSLADLQSFVARAHALGMKVILDWVANHSAWDNWLVTEHPDWYDTDWKGDFRPTVWTDWSDIIDFDYSSPELRKYMTESLVYWVEEVGIDGYRADVAGYVPLDFWDTARAQLDEIKPVFMLAEWQTRDLHQRAFDATYGWAWKEAAQDIARGRGDAGRIRGFYADDLSTWPADAMRMLYTANHDQNSWDGTAFDIYGEAYKTFMALQFVSRGIPLIYNGQEAGLDKQLAFFERDPIVWRAHEMADFIAKLIALKTDNRALWNGTAGGATIPVSTDNSGQIMSFARQKGDSKIVALFNLSPRAARFKLTDGPIAGQYKRFSDGTILELDFETDLQLAPWDYYILIAKTP